MRFYLGKSQKSTNEKSVITKHEGLISRKGTKRGSMRQNCIKEKGGEEKGQKAEGVCERREGRDEAS